MCRAIPIGNSVSPIGNSQKRPPEDGDVSSLPVSVPHYPSSIISLELVDHKVLV